jgi:dephospho-CoA kinase
VATALTVGLTGGVASGKSSVEALFRELGVAVLDADQLARDVVAPGSPALAQIAQDFGTQMLLPDGQLDRRRMRERVFGDAAERRRLEAITHPHIRAGMLAWKAAQTGAYCIISVAILVESGMQALVDRTLVVDVAETSQLQRLCVRDGITPELAQNMLAAQTSRQRRLDAASDVLGNHGELDALRAGVAQLDAFYRELAASGRLTAPGLRIA